MQLKYLYLKNILNQNYQNNKNNNIKNNKNNKQIIFKIIMD